MNKYSIVIQARLSSTRLPKKVLKSFFKEKNILSIQLQELNNLDIPIVLATTDRTDDEPLIDLAQEFGVNYYQGSENDVLLRFIAASDADYIIRVCSDNPFLDMNSIQAFLNELEENTDYISFQNNQGTPAIKTHWGLFTEVVSRKALIKAHQATKGHPEEIFYREHVTNYIYGHPNQFEVKLLEAPAMISNRSDLRFTIDTHEDFENMQRLYHIIEQEDRDFSLENLVKTADAHSEIKKVMEEGIAKFNK